MYLYQMNMWLYKIHNKIFIDKHNPKFNKFKLKHKKKSSHTLNINIIRYKDWRSLKVDEKKNKEKYGLASIHLQLHGFYLLFGQNRMVKH